MIDDSIQLDQVTTTKSTNRPKKPVANGTDEPAALTPRERRLQAKLDVVSPVVGEDWFRRSHGQLISNLSPTDQCGTRKNHQSVRLAQLTARD